MTKYSRFDNSPTNSLAVADASTAMNLYFLKIAVKLGVSQPGKSKMRDRQLVEFLKINPYRLKFLVGPARARSKAFLAQALRQLIDTDFKIKSGQADKKFLLDMALIRLSGIK